MTFDVEIMLRGNETVHTETLSHDREADAWRDADVGAVVRQILRAIERVQHPDEPAEGPLSLRGISWIASPYRGGVVIALEIDSASAVAGPFPLAQQALHDMLARVLSAPSPGETVH